MALATSNAIVVLPTCLDPSRATAGACRRSSVSRGTSRRANILVVMEVHSVICKVPAELSDPARPVGLEARAELAKAPCIERIAYLLHQVQVVVQIVDGGQHGPQHLAA